MDETAQVGRDGRAQRRTLSKDAAVGVRLANELKLAAIKAAAAERRSVSSLMEKILVDYLMSEGYLSPDQTGAEASSEAKRAKK